MKLIWNLELGTWNLELGTRYSDAGQIVDDLAPISRLEGDIFCRGYWILDAGNVICDLGSKGCLV